MKTTDFENIRELLCSIEYREEKLLMDDVIDAVHVVSKKVIEPLQKSGHKDWFNIDDIIARSEALHEEQGFINGFICAMQLKMESCKVFIDELKKVAV